MDRDIVYALEREQNLKTNEICKEKQKMKRWHVRKNRKLEFKK